jgi:ubiquinone/menaquinone biosynthesis C-methylase UbiE
MWAPIQNFDSVCAAASRDFRKLVFQAGGCLEMPSRDTDGRTNLAKLGGRVPEAGELDDSGERMIPEYHSGHLLYAEHLIRYQAVKELVRGKVVLDIASGSGYGSALLGETAAQVYGYDASEDAVNYAMKHYGFSNVQFAVADATNIPLPDNSVDVAVTFETLEHVADYESFIREIRRVLKPEGLAVVSTPNDLEFAEGNHFHLHEFERSELLTLLRKYFEEIDEYYQATSKYVALDRLGTFSASGLVQRTTINLSSPDADQVLYFYFVCSARAIVDVLDPIAAIGEHYSDRALVQVQMKQDEELRDLRATIGVQQEAISAQQVEIDHIKSSSTFKFAQKLARARGKFRR